MWVFGSWTKIGQGVLEQLDLPGGLISRFKFKLRPLISQQYRSTLRKGVAEHLRGRISYAQILRCIQKAAAEAYDPEACIEDNKKMGYYIAPATRLCAAQCAGRLGRFFQTNVAFGGGGVEGEATVEMARKSAQIKADASIAKARTKVLA